MSMKPGVQNPKVYTAASTGFGVEAPMWILRAAYFFSRFERSTRYSAGLGHHQEHFSLSLFSELFSTYCEADALWAKVVSS